METVELPVVTADTILKDAFDQLLQLKQPACVVVQPGGGAYLYHAEDLNLQLPERAGRAMRNVGGAIWVPDAPSPPGATATLLRQNVQLATIGFLSPEAARDMRLAFRLYICSKDSNHTYTPSQVKNLKPIPGGWECSQGDQGLVK